MKKLIIKYSKTLVSIAFVYGVFAIVGGLNAVEWSGMAKFLFCCIALFIGAFAHDNY